MNDKLITYISEIAMDGGIFNISGNSSKVIINEVLAKLCMKYNNATFGYVCSSVVMINDFFINNIIEYYKSRTITNLLIKQIKVDTLDINSNKIIFKSPDHMIGKRVSVMFVDQAVNASHIATVLPCSNVIFLENANLKLLNVIHINSEKLKLW